VVSLRILGRRHSSTMMEIGQAVAGNPETVTNFLRAQVDEFRD
jgi:hypothetical protein